MRRQRLRVPLPLAALLGVVAILILAWSLFDPPFEVPDEPAHLAYVQSIAENFERPRGYPPRNVPPFSLQEQLAAAADRGFQTVRHADARPSWSQADSDRWSRIDRKLPRSARSKIGGAIEQAQDPPLYYAYEAIAYRLSPGSGFFDRLLAMRLWSGLLLLVATAAAWCLAGEILGRNRPLQLVAAGCVGLQPMAAFLSGGVSQDAGWLALGVVNLWLGVRLMSRGPSVGRIAALLAAAVAAVLVKTAAITIVPAVGVALLVAALRAPPPARAAFRRFLPLVVGCVAVTAVALLTTRQVGSRAPGFSDLHGFASYLWQYYLPHLPGQKRFAFIPELAVYNVWLKTSWGAFGWLDVRFPERLYALLAVLSVAAFAGGAWAIVRRRVVIDRAVLIFFGVAVLSLLAGQHLAEYHSLKIGAGPLNQGRYLLPVVLPIAGVATALGLTNLRPERRALGVAAVLGGMLALELFSLALIAQRFYV